MIDKLTDLNDPRLAVFAEPAQALGEYVGMPYGVNAAIAGSIKNEEVSLPARVIITPPFLAAANLFRSTLPTSRSRRPRMDRVEVPNPYTTTQLRLRWSSGE